MLLILHDHNIIVNEKTFESQDYILHNLLQRAVVNLPEMR